MNLPDSDHHAHLRLIHGLTATLRKWTDQFDEEAKRASARTARDEYEESQIIDIFYHAGFADLARSHAVICTISAFLESLFKTNFRAVWQRGEIAVSAKDPRLVGLGGNIELFWDLEKCVKREGIAKRIAVILSATGLAKYFGTDFEKEITAIFDYRNQMVHNGFEWPQEVREAFNQRATENNWSQWFSVATSNHQPWFYTITPEFHETCLQICDRSVLAFEGLLVGDWELYDLKFGPRQP